MPTTPYIVYGTITDTSNSAVQNVAVVFTDTTTNEYTSTRTDSQGKYAIDLANLTGGWTSGDSVTASVRTKGYIGESTFTISGENKLLNFTVETISFSTLRNKAWMIVYNVLQTGTYAISEDSIFSAMNDQIVATEGYPLVIIEPPKISNNIVTLNRDGFKKKSISFNIMVYHKTAENVKILTDEVENKLDSAWKVFYGAGMRNMEFPEGDYDWYTEGNKKIHIMSVPVTFDVLG